MILRRSMRLASRGVETAHIRCMALGMPLRYIPNEQMLEVDVLQRRYLDQTQWCVRNVEVIDGLHPAGTEHTNKEAQFGS